MQPNRRVRHPVTFCLSYHCEPEICDIFTFIQVRLLIQMKWSIKKSHSVLQNYKQAKTKLGLRQESTQR